MFRGALLISRRIKSNVHDFLDNYDFNSTDANTLSDVVKSVTNFLKKAEYHYTTILDSSVEEEEQEDTIVSKTVYIENFLDSTPLQKIKDELRLLRYISTESRNKNGNCTKGPDVCLFGEEPYVYIVRTL